MLVSTDGISCSCELKTNCCSDVSRVNFVKLCPLIRMHLQDTPYTLLLAFRCIQHIRTRIHRTGIHTEECKLADKGVSHDFECQRREWLFIRRMPLNFISFHINPLDSRDIGRSRHIIQDCIQELLDALIAVSRSAAYRDCSAFACAFPQGCFHRFHGRHLVIQVLHHQLVI